VGLSLGGLFARDLAYQCPNDIRQVITIASPFHLPTATVIESVIHLFAMEAGSGPSKPVGGTPEGSVDRQGNSTKAAMGSRNLVTSPRGFSRNVAGRRAQDRAQRRPAAARARRRIASRMQDGGEEHRAQCCYGATASRWH